MVTVVKNRPLGAIRACSMCKQELALSEFYSINASYCKPCQLKYLKAKRFGARDAAESRTRQDGKVCSQCGALKPAADFVRSNHEQDRHAARCNECREVLRKAKQARMKKPYDAGAALRRKYGISQKQYDDLLAAQGYGCAICKRPPDGPKKPLNVDHDHVTGRIRGLLCAPCNTALGFLRDSPMFCRAAAVYLENTNQGALT